MAPVTHSLIGWWSANVLPLQRRDRLAILAAGVLPDLDGLGIIFEGVAYEKYHHVLCHNLAGCLVLLLCTGSILACVSAGALAPADGRP